MTDRLRTAALLYGAAIAIHVVDHLRRGVSASPRSVLVAGAVSFVFQALAIAAVLARHRLAAVLALAVALPDAIGVVLVHLVPGGTDALVGAHAAPGATAFSVVTAALEVATGLALTWVAWGRWRAQPA
jgi:predicted Na+-dependent transporter